MKYKLEIRKVRDNECPEIYDDEDIELAIECFFNAIKEIDDISEAVRDNFTLTIELNKCISKEELNNLIKPYWENEFRFVSLEECK